MIDVVYVSDTNKMGDMKYKWLKWLIESTIPDAVLRHEYTPFDVFKINEAYQDGIISDDEEVNYEVAFDKKGNPVVISSLFDQFAINPDVIIIDDLTRANPACSEKIYNRSRIFHECIKRGIQTHVIAPDLTMSYAGGLEIDRGVKLPFERYNDFTHIHVWYGVNNIEDVEKVKMWNQIWKKMPNSVKEKNIITGVCYAYLKKHRDEIKESMKSTPIYASETSKYGYYGFWRRGALLDSVMNSGVDTVIGSFKWRPECDKRDIEWINGNKTLEEVFSILSKSYIPYEYPKSDIQHVFRQFEGLVYARDGVEYSDDYPESMRVYDINDPKLKEIYYPVISRFIELIRSSHG